MKKLILLGVFMLFAVQSRAQYPVPEFEQYAWCAQVLFFIDGVPPSVRLAQAFCETNFGKADTIGTIYNNWFSIKDYPEDSWKGKSGPMMDCFGISVCIWRWYVTPLQCWLDHSRYMRENAPPGHAFNDWIYWVTHPMKYGWDKYWQRISNTIKIYKLYKYDFIIPKTA